MINLRGTTRSGVVVGLGLAIPGTTRAGLTKSWPSGPFLTYKLRFATDPFLTIQPGFATNPKKLLSRSEETEHSLKFSMKECRSFELSKVVYLQRGV